MHPVEQIMQAVVAAVTGLATTQARVYRGKTFPIPEEDENALLIYQGGDDPEVELTAQDTDSDLEFTVLAYVATTEDQAETELNQIRLEVHRALSPVNPALGLAFTLNIEPTGAAAPDARPENAKVKAGMEIGWICTYRANHFDPEITGG